jgi:hypothetical protein
MLSLPPSVRVFVAAQPVDQPPVGRWALRRNPRFSWGAARRALWLCLHAVDAGPV